MLVTIVGPNLPVGSKGTFVVHRAGCKDLDKLRAYIQDSDTIEVKSMRAAAEFVYPPGEFEYWDEDPDSYIDDLWFAPCVQQQLTRNDPSG